MVHSRKGERRTRITGRVFWRRFFWYLNMYLEQRWHAALNQIRTWARANSPWAIHFNSGSCNGCDIEILATLTPRYDGERFGIKLQGSPRHGDILICTGPVTRQARERLPRACNRPDHSG